MQRGEERNKAAGADGDCEVVEKAFEEKIGTRPFFEVVKECVRMTASILEFDSIRTYMKTKITAEAIIVLFFFAGNRNYTHILYHALV